ncbi:MAG: lactonase family protein [Bacteroidales bacterium]|nr:lactonase family protein [Bacteroidales bacterium]
MRNCSKLFFSGLLTFTLIITGCSERHQRLYVGSFTKPGQKGFSIFDFNSRSGQLKLVKEVDVGPNPSYFCYSERNKLFYFLNEVMEFNGVFGGGLTTFRYNPDDLTFEKQNEIIIPYAGPCYISMSPDSSFLLVANYPNGSVAVVTLDESGKPLSVTDTILYVKEEPDRSHAHMILSDPGGKNIYVTDLGLDRITYYSLDTSTGRLSRPENGSVTLPGGSGPRHFVFNDEGTRMYVINELGSTISVFSVGEDGGLAPVQTVSTVREGFQGNNYCADIHIGPSGKYLYGSNRGENTIVTFSIEADGTLKLVGHTSCGGDWPRNFTLDPSGKFLLVGNQKSDTIAVFRLNRSTGMPKDPPGKFRCISPACLKFFKE